VQFFFLFIWKMKRKIFKIRSAFLYIACWMNYVQVQPDAANSVWVGAECKTRQFSPKLWGRRHISVKIDGKTWIVSFEMDFKMIKVGHYSAWKCKGSIFLYLDYQKFKLKNLFCEDFEHWKLKRSFQESRWDFENPELKRIKLKIVKY
jgi:hypothetical protein